MFVLYSSVYMEHADNESQEFIFPNFVVNPCVQVLF